MTSRDPECRGCDPDYLRIKISKTVQPAATGQMLLHSTEQFLVFLLLEIDIYKNHGDNTFSTENRSQTFSTVSL